MWQGEEDEESSVSDGLAGLFKVDSALAHVVVVVVVVGLSGLVGLESLVGFLIGSTWSKESDVWDEEGEDGEPLPCSGLDGSGSKASVVVVSSSEELSMPSSSS